MCCPFFASTVSFDDEGILADGRQPRLAAAANQEAAGEQLVAGLLFDLIRLAGDEGFIDLARPLDDLGIGKDLVAILEDHDIIPDRPRRVQGKRLSIADDRRLRG